MNWKIASEAMRRHRQRHDQLAEDREVAGAVDAGRLDDLLGQRRDEVLEDEDAERHAEADVGDPDRGDAVVEVEVGEDRDGADVGAAGEQPQQRDQRHLQRHDQHGDDGHEQPVAALELHPRERVGGQRGDADRQDARPEW